MSLPPTVEDSLITVDLDTTPPPSQPDQECIEEFYLQQPFNNHNYWCWAVVAEGFSKFLRGEDGLSQRAIADRACIVRYCEYLDDCYCDTPWYLEEALKIALDIEVEPDGTEIPFENIAREIRENTMPVGCRLTESAGHFGVIVGFKQDEINQYVTLILNSDNTLIEWEYISFIQNRSDFYLIHGENTWNRKYRRALKTIYKFFAKL
jgi:hypothetical protein